MTKPKQVCGTCGKEEIPLTTARAGEHVHGGNVRFVCPDCPPAEGEPEGVDVEELLRAADMGYRVCPFAEYPELKKAIRKLAAQRDKLQRRHVALWGSLQEAEAKVERLHALVMAVGNKYPGETRYETALRYIQQAERSSGCGEAQRAKKEKT